MRLGLIINEISNFYGRQTWDGFFSKCRDLDVQPVAVCGEPFDSPVNNEAVYNNIYDMISDLQLDGLIVELGTLISYSGPEIVIEYFDKLDIPKVWLGGEHPTGISVVPKLEKPFKELVSYAVEIYGASNIGIITGSVVHPETKARQKAIFDALALYNITIPQDSIVTGDFQIKGGYDAAKKLLANNPSVECIFAHNDSMALGALEYLKSIDKRVPYDIILFGVDDVCECQYSEPTLSTISQNMKQATQKSVELLHSLILSNGTLKPLQRVLKIEGTFINRNSSLVATSNNLYNRSLSQLSFYNEYSITGMLKNNMQALFSRLSIKSWERRLEESLKRFSLSWAGFYYTFEKGATAEWQVFDGEILNRRERLPQKIARQFGKFVPIYLESVLFFPLVVDDEFLGVACFELNPKLDFCYTSLAGQIAAAYKATELLGKHEKLEERLLFLEKELSFLKSKK